MCCKNLKNKDEIFAIAPMMDWTDRHCRAFHRVLTREALLYTEMVTADAVRFGDRARLLARSPGDAPVALQIGGSDACAVAEATRIGADHGFDEINLNCGCPSDRVQSGRFGACLMAEPYAVARLVGVMRDAVANRDEAPVITVKCRIGIDDQDSEADLQRFAAAVIGAGAQRLIVHARKAWLQGLSPKENRTVPPLDYDRVYRLKATFPQIPIVINGGIADLNQVHAHLDHVDGVMLGRAAYERPALLLDVDQLLYGDAAPSRSAEEAVIAFRPYIADMLAQGERLSRITRHMVGLFQGRPGARRYRRILSEEGVRSGAGLEVLDKALQAVIGTGEDQRTGEGTASRADAA